MAESGFRWGLDHGCQTMGQFRDSVGFRAQEMELNMKTMKKLIVTMCMTALLPLAFAQSAPPPRVNPAEAKNHLGETAVVCGKVVDTKTSRYGIAGRGKPVTFDLDQPEPNPVFYFVTFGAQPGGPEEALAAYKDKRVCVTGKIRTQAGVPFIMAVDRSLIKLQAENK